MESQATQRPSQDIQTELSRDLGLPSTLAIGVGTMIAAGIFTLSGLAVGYVGSAAIVAFIAAAVVATFTALTYCEFTSIYPESGEGYLYARRTFSPPLAYLVGWCLLLGYTSSCGFYIASFSTYFNEFIWRSPFEMLSGLVVVIGLTLLNIRGTKESGRFQIIVTVGKVLLLIWFIGGGLGHVDMAVVAEKFNTDITAIGSTSALVFVTFFGFSAIAASAGEVVKPTQTIPRAIFISMGLVTVLYVLVVLVIVAADLTDYSESAMGTAAQNFLGPAGGMVIVAGALFSMVSASNASIMAGSRVALSMSRRGHLPKEIGAINAQTRTPIIAIVLVGGGIGTFALLLPLEELAHFADCVLLIALILVNAALIKHRRKYPHLKRPFRVPLVPLTPALGIVANIYLLTQLPHLLPVLLAAGSLLVGFLGFLAWKGTQAIEKVALPGQPSRTALERSAGEERRYRVLVPIANPGNVDQLIDLACSIAKRQDGKLIVMRAVVLPEQIAPSVETAYVERERGILDLARDRAKANGVPVTSLVRIGHNAARAILDTSRDHRCDLIVLGWRGHVSTTQHILGEVTDDVINHARTDILLAKLTDHASWKRLLLPTAGGEHARSAQRYAAAIVASEGGSVTLCSVVAPDAPAEALESEEERLRKSVEWMLENQGIDTDFTVIRHRSISEGIIAEGERYDAIIVGAAGKSFSNQILFGSIPEEIARNSAKPVIVIKRHHRVKALLGRVMSE
jgi:amino acid transporter/nucleotide-binding universal stress UspA family protein